LFKGEDVFKKIRVLSGGEKSRLALAKMLMTPSNFIILDEPTNHLDMQSKKILQQALQQFEGTCMIVSHDRSFLDPVVNKTLEVQPGRIRTLHGNVSHYLDLKSREEEQDTSARQTEETGIEDNNGRSRKEIRRLEAQRRQEKAKKLKPLQSRLGEIENEIESGEQRKREIEEVMADPDFYEDEEEVKKVSLEYETLKNNLSRLLAKWEEVAGRIEFIEEEE
ncbi:MAG: ATP-binding cassette domain-containing protein, partial [Balneolaceae bacterium]